VRNAIQWVTLQDAPWIYQTPITGTISAGAAQSVNVIFDSNAVTNMGLYTTTLVMDSDDPVNSWAGVPVTMTLTAFGVRLNSAPSQSGDPGTTVSHTLSVLNTGLVSDTFYVLVSGHDWAVSAPASSGPLAPGAQKDLEVTVRIPVTATGQAQDQATITAVSHRDDRQTDTIMLTTRANNVYDVLAFSPDDTKFGLPGGAVAYTLQITNAGNTSDTFHLTTSGNAWPVVVPVGDRMASATIAVGPLMARASASVEIMVIIPQDAASGATDTVSVAVTSQGDKTLSSAAMLNTLVPTSHYQLRKQAQPSQSVRVGQYITYTLVVTTNRPDLPVTLSDTLPANSLFISASGLHSPIQPGPGDTLVWQLAPGDWNAGVAQRTLVLSVTQAASGSTLTNTAHISDVSDSAALSVLPAITGTYQVHLPLLIKDSH
jgi:uncharacterized repeat protein (TIGR01451 family)